MTADSGSAPPAVTIVQPWAWGLIYGSRRAHMLGHRAKHLGTHLVYAARTQQFITPSARGCLPGLPPENRLAYGAFIGTVDVVDCCRDGSLWRWEFENPRPIRPIPFVGSTRPFEVPEEVWQSVHYIEPGASTT